MAPHLSGYEVAIILQTIAILFLIVYVLHLLDERRELSTWLAGLEGEARKAEAKPEASLQARAKVEAVAKTEAVARPVAYAMTPELAMPATEAKTGAEPKAAAPAQRAREESRERSLVH